MIKHNSTVIVAIVFLSLFVPRHSLANVETVKLYKNVFEGEKPKCACCHVDKTPKKEEGKHELNDYGKKILVAKKELNKEKVDEEVLKKVGKNEQAES